MKLFWKSILPVFVAMLLFEGMVTACHLFILASTQTVVAGFLLRWTVWRSWEFHAATLCS